MLYDRPVHELFRDAARQLPSPTTPNEIINWFAREYPLVKKTTVIAHIKGLTVNDRNRRHYSVSRHEPVFTWTPEGVLDLYDPDKHLDDEDVAADEDEADSDTADGRPITEANAEFVLEAHLEEFLLGNWDSVDWGRPLSLWRGLDGVDGHQLPTGIGRLDLLCVDTSTNALVVVELKRGRSADRVIGQVARYMGWVRMHVAANGQSVEGIIVAHEHDDKLRYAATAVAGLAIFTYHVTFQLHPVPGLGLGLGES